MTNEELYKEYPHIIPGSIEEIPRGQIIVCGKNDKIKSHGRICVINCSGFELNPKCLKTRIINTQDLHQVTKCKECVRIERNTRRRLRRMAAKHL